MIIWSSLMLNIKLGWANFFSTDINFSLKKTWTYKFKGLRKYRSFGNQIVGLMVELDGRSHSSLLSICFLLLTNIWKAVYAKPAIPSLKTRKIKQQRMFNFYHCTLSKYKKTMMTLATAYVWVKKYPSLVKTY